MRFFLNFPKLPAMALFVISLTMLAYIAAFGRTMNSAPPAAINFFNYAAANGCTLTTEQQFPYTLFFNNLINNGLLGTFDIYNMNGLAPTDTCAEINLINPGYATGTEFGNIIFSPNGCLQGDGESAYIDLGVTPAGLKQFSQNSAHIGGWPLVVIPSQNNPILGVIGSSNNLELDANSPSNIMFGRINSLTNTNGLQASPNNVLTQAGDRTSSTSLFLYTGGQLGGSNTNIASTAPVTGNLNVFRDGGNSTIVYSAGTICSWHVGSGLTAAQEAALFTSESFPLQFAGAVPSPPNSDAINGPNFFTGSGAGTMNNTVNSRPWRVTMATTTPADNNITQSTFAYFPATVFHTQNMRYEQNTSSYTNGKVSVFLWTMNIHHPNPQYPSMLTSASKQARMVFSTYTIARGCALARASWSTGHAATISSGPQAGHGYMDLWTSYGGNSSNLYFYDSTDGTPDALDNVNTLFTNTTTSPPYATDANGSGTPLDYCVLSQGKLALVGNVPIDGVVIDWEPQDSPVATSTTQVLQTMAMLAHEEGYTITIYTNPLDGSSFAKNGFIAKGQPGANLDTILSSVDYFDLLLYDGNPEGDVIASLNTQMGLFATPVPSKFQVLAQLSGLSVNDTANIYTTAQADGLAGVDIFGGGRVFGGQCSRPTNEEIGNLVNLPTC